MKTKKLILLAALLVMLAVVFYFSQNLSEKKPEIESLQGLNEELNGLLSE